MHNLYIFPTKPMANRYLCDYYGNTMFYQPMNIDTVKKIDNNMTVIVSCITYNEIIEDRFSNVDGQITIFDEKNDIMLSTNSLKEAITHINPEIDISVGNIDCVHEFIPVYGISTNPLGYDCKYCGALKEEVDAIKDKDVNIPNVDTSNSTNWSDDWEF